MIRRSVSRALRQDAFIRCERCLTLAVRRHGTDLHREQDRYEDRSRALKKESGPCSVHSVEATARNVVDGDGCRASVRIERTKVSCVVTDVLQQSKVKLWKLFTCRKLLFRVLPAGAVLNRQTSRSAQSLYADRHWLPRIRALRERRRSTQQPAGSLDPTGEVLCAVLRGRLLRIVQFESLYSYLCSIAISSLWCIRANHVQPYIACCLW